MKRTIVAAAILTASAFTRLYADTSWIIQPMATTSKSMQVFTSRSGKSMRPLMLHYNQKIDDKSFRNLRCGNDTKFAYAGINECGLVVVFSGSDKTKDTPVKPKGKQTLISGNFIVGHLLTRCNSVKQAEARLRKLARSGFIAESLIVFLADGKQAMIFEIAPRHYATMGLGLHYTVYANRWKLPGMEDASKRMPGDMQGSLQEEWAVKEAIYRARGGMNGKLSIPSSFAVSRRNAADVKVKGIGRAPSAKYTADAYLFEIDPEYPGLLSCVYASFGPPRHTVYLPIPAGAMDALPPEVVKAEWAKIGAELNKTIPETTPVSEDLAEFEKYLLQEFNDIRHQAKLLLKEGKTEEARTLLRDTLRRQSRETLKFMNGRKQP